MDKTQLLALVQQKIQEGIITKQDIDTLSSYNENKPEVQSHNITNIFYIIGAIITVIGVVILLAQNWTDIGFVGRVLSTLGISIVSYVVGFVLLGNVHRILSQVFFTLSGILAPIGVFVAYSEFELIFNSLAQTATALALFTLFFAAWWYTKRNILVLWNMLWITWGYYSLLSYVFILTADITKMATIILGITYLCFTYYFDKNILPIQVEERREKNVLQNILYAMGVGLIVIPSLFFGGIFDFVTLLLIFASFYLSIFVKSRFTLIVSGVLLVSYILKITSKYFVNSIGWPLSLIAIGFFVIAIGYWTLYVVRTYIPKTKV